MTQQEDNNIRLYFHQSTDCMSVHEKRQNRVIWDSPGWLRDHTACRWYTRKVTYSKFHLYRVQTERGLSFVLGLSVICFHLAQKKQTGVWLQIFENLSEMKCCKYSANQKCSIVQVPPLKEAYYAHNFILGHLGRSDRFTCFSTQNTSAFSYCSLQQHCILPLLCCSSCLFKARLLNTQSPLIG